MDFAILTQTLVADVFANKLPGLTKIVTVRYFVSDGGYDAENDSNSPVYTDVPGVVCIAAKPTFADVTDHRATFSDTKLIIPGKFLTKEPETDTDRVILDGEEWRVRKAIGVPGAAVFIVYVYRI